MHEPNDSNSLPNWLGVFSNPNYWYTGPVWEMIGWVGMLAVWVWNDMLLIWGHVHWGWILWGLRGGGCVAGVWRVCGGCVLLVVVV